MKNLWKVFVTNTVKFRTKYKKPSSQSKSYQKQDKNVQKYNKFTKCSQQSFQRFKQQQKISNKYKSYCSNFENDYFNQLTFFLVLQMNQIIKPRLFLPHRFINNQQLTLITLTQLQRFLYIEYSMSEQELINDELKHFQDIINEKITSIREILHEEDKAIVDQIVMKKSHSTDPIYPKYDKKICYYQEFWKVYLLNEIMISKIKDYSVSNKQLNKDVQTLDDAQKQWTQLWTQKSKKKIRRTSDMIQKVFDCPFEKCCRTYGSDVSLNLHMKLKHNSGTKTQRQALAKQICLAQEKGLKIKIDLNFPPGYLQQFRQNFRRQNV